MIIIREQYENRFLKHKTSFLFLLLAVVLSIAIYSHNSFSAIDSKQGDLNGSKAIDLKDANIALRIISGDQKSFNHHADVNNDGKIGLEEAIVVLQSVSIQKPDYFKIIYAFYQRIIQRVSSMKFFVNWNDPFLNWSFWSLTLLGAILALYHVITIIKTKLKTRSFQLPFLNEIQLWRPVQQFNKITEDYENNPKWSVNEIIIVLTVMTAGLLIRSYNITNFTQGMLSGDEIFMSHIILKQILVGEQTSRGISAYGYFFLSHLWYSFFGFTATNIRYMSVFLGTLAIFFTYLFARKVYCKSIALIAIIFFSVSVFHAHFSRIGMDIGNAVPFVGLFLFLYISTFSKKSLLMSVLTAFTMVLGMFVYPGFLPVLPALLLTVLFMAVINIGLVKSNIRHLMFNHVVMIIVSAGLYLLVYNFHFNILRNTIPMFRGGGSLYIDAKAMADAFKILMKDLFWHAETWYLANITKQSFFEKSLLPFFVVGVMFCFLKKHSSHLFEKLTTFKYVSFEAFFIISFSVFSVLLVMISGAYPGARRIIIILPFFYILAAFAIHNLFRIPFYRWTVVTALLCLVLSINTLKFFKETVWWNQKQTITTHDDTLYPLIEELSLWSNIILINEEVGTQYACENYISYLYLFDYYNKSWRDHQTVYILNKDADLIKKQTIKGKADKFLLITSTPKDDKFLSKISGSASIEKGFLNIHPKQKSYQLHFYSFDNFLFE